MTTTFDAITAGLRILQERLKTGDLVYIDSFTGLIPGKITSIVPSDRGDGSFNIVVKVTATRGAYKRGQSHVWSANKVLARRAVFTRDHQLRIRQLNYTYEPTKEGN